jgi:hypothetical protein
MEINKLGTTTLASALSSSKDINGNADAFEDLLNSASGRLAAITDEAQPASTTPSSGGISDFASVVKMGILQYARELRIQEMRDQIRITLLHEMGISEKIFNTLKAGIDNLAANENVPQTRIDALQAKFAKLEKDIELEVERRLLKRLEEEIRKALSSQNSAPLNDLATLDRLVTLMKEVRNIYSEYRTIVGLSSASQNSSEVPSNP